MTIVAEPEQRIDVEDIPVEQWREIEDAFRVHAFTVYYKRTFREELHPLKRFVKALLASARPIQDHQAVVDWYYSRHRRRRPG